jgi:hypothetical protein
VALVKLVGEKEVSERWRRIYGGARGAAVAYLILAAGIGR